MKAYGHQFPAYRDDPIAETIRAVPGLSGEGYSERYAAFLRDMVYSDERPAFEAAMTTISTLTAHLEKDDGEGRGSRHALQRLAWQPFPPFRTGNSQAPFIFLSSPFI